MKFTTTILVFVSFLMSSCSQQYKYPGQLEIKTFKIGDKVDTTNFNNIGNLYFPNYLDGWNMDNFDQLPDNYKGLPIAIWQLKSDSAVALTLLNDVVLNITVSYMTVDEKNSISKIIKEKLGADGKVESYEQTHPLQSWITYWKLLTWKTKEVIIQIGNSDMRKPNMPEPTNMRWNLTYSDFLIENKIIDDFKKVLFSNEADSLIYFKQLNARNNRLNPPK